MVVCVLSEQRGRAASEEVLDRGMDWAQRLGWVEVQVQASLAEQRQIKEGLHSKPRGPFVTGKSGTGRSAAAALQHSLLLNLNWEGEDQEFL